MTISVWIALVELVAGNIPGKKSVIVVWNFTFLELLYEVPQKESLM